MGPMQRKNEGNGVSGHGRRSASSRDVAAITTVEPENILVVLPNWVGDLVLATPALRSIRTRFPSSRISFLLRGPLEPILAGGDWMDEFIHWPQYRGQSKPSRRKSFLGFAGELKRKQFDWAILLTNSFRSAMLSRLAAIPRRIGYDRDGRGLLLTDRLLPAREKGQYVPMPMIRYYNAIARYVGCRECGEATELFTTTEEEAGASERLAAAGVRDGMPYVMLNPGAAYGPAKMWLPERFAETGDRLARERNAAVLIMCGPKEVDIARRIESLMEQPATVLADPVPSLGIAKALVRRSILLVTNDTGPRHFANACRVPVVTIFGPTFPEWTDGDYPLERIAMIPVDCGPCMKRRCPLDHRCMTGITTDRVMGHVSELLDVESR